jgi:hypothetical protein
MLIHPHKSCNRIDRIKKQDRQDRAGYNGKKRLQQDRQDCDRIRQDIKQDRQDKAG